MAEGIFRELVTTREAVLARSESGEDIESSEANEGRSMSVRLAQANYFIDLGHAGAADAEMAREAFLAMLPPRRTVWVPRSRLINSTD